MGPSEGQISQSLSQVVESFNSHGETLTAQPKKSDLGLGSSSSFPATERLENDGIARVEQECQQESDDDYSSIDWTDTEEEVEPTIQQGTEPSIQQEVEPIIQENAEEGMLLNSFYEASITLILKPDKDIAHKKLQVSITDEYRCKNPQQNTSNLNPIIC